MALLRCPHPSYLMRKILVALVACTFMLLLIQLIGRTPQPRMDTNFEGNENVQRRIHPAHTPANRNRSSLPAFFVDESTNRFRHGCYERGIIKEYKLLLPNETLKELKCEQRPPDAIVFGVKKGGTTTLKEFLAFHPGVTVTPKEVQFFSNYSLSKQGFAKYTSFMPYSMPGQVMVEKSTSYFVRGKCAERMKAMIPNCKLIAVLSDPIQRAVSDYVHMVWTRDNMPQKANELEPDRHRAIPHYELKPTFRDSVLYPNGSVKTWNTLIDSGMYYNHARDWLEFFPPENFLYLDAHDLVNNPVKIFRQLERFLGLPSFFSDEVFHFNETKGFYCIRYPVYSCMPPAKGRSHPVVGEATIRTLQEYFEPHNVEFSKLISKTFSWTTYHKKEVT